ncbi:membrane protein DedA with SNARE-associated domain [Homoserinimonas aerilata]|uniref:Membrane protein DedA with SNARE-associated domain n=1 Tax=Homoserinimonas aerilata TaxID=1162970 RepID=A0A542YG89_9MICO|nr:VTT domain-containing protein [Homoserinimonas aerilata]TQL47095.1 membrane protein DedA with SNARE-associated domain [Homoserinimonas aerilata]
MDQLIEWATDAAGSPWVYAIVFVLTVSDAFLVVVPSETVVVALGALALATGEPELAVLVPVAAVAAIIGDNLTYLLGRTMGVTRFRWMRRPRIVAVFAWASRALGRRAAVVMLTARFVPFGRIAVNLVAGATRFRYRHFLPLSVIAGCGWSLYNALIGAAFGTWFRENPVLAVVLSIVVAISLGLLVDQVSAWVARRRLSGSEAKQS